MVGLSEARPRGGVALHREWLADSTQVSCSSENLDALLVSAAEPAALAGLLIAALRLDLPTVVTSPEDPFTVALAALGFAPTGESSAEVVVEAARNGGPRPRELVEGFSLANALRAGLALDAGPELLVHLAAIAREAGATGFSQMIRVLAPESPAVIAPHSSWFEAHGAAGLFAYLGTALHDTPTVSGRLKENLPPAPPVSQASGSPLLFARGRASGMEAVCWTDREVAQVSGNCRFYASEEAAVRAVKEGAVGSTDLLVVCGCGPRGGPGLLRLDRLAEVLAETGLAGNVPILTDGLPPNGAVGAWISLATPEAVSRGVIGRLRDGDLLRIDLREGFIRTDIVGDELIRREPLPPLVRFGFGYAGRYAASTLPALEGAGFGF